MISESPYFGRVGSRVVTVGFHLPATNPTTVDEQEAYEMLSTANPTMAALTKKYQLLVPGMITRFRQRSSDSIVVARNAVGKLLPVNIHPRLVDSYANIMFFIKEVWDFLLRIFFPSICTFPDCHPSHSAVVDGHGQVIKLKLMGPKPVRDLVHRSPSAPDVLHIM